MTSCARDRDAAYDGLTIRASLTTACPRRCLLPRLAADPTGNAIRHDISHGRTDNYVTPRNAQPCCLCSWAVTQAQPKVLARC